MKKFLWTKCRKIMLQTLTKTFTKFPRKIFTIILRDIIGLKFPIAFQLVIIQNFDV